MCGTCWKHKMLYVLCVVLLLVAIFMVASKERLSQANYDSIEQDTWGEIHGTKDQKIRYPKIGDLYKYGDVTVPYWKQDGYNPPFKISTA